MTKIEQPKKKFEELQQKQNFFISSTKYQMPAHTISARTFRHSVVRDAICLHLDQHNQVRNGKTLRPVIERLPKSLIPPKFAGKVKCINDKKKITQVKEILLGKASEPNTNRLLMPRQQPVKGPIPRPQEIAPKILTPNFRPL